MRIGEPARKHGIAEEDIWHAVRNAIARADDEDDFLMLIGPAQDGTLLEIGIVGPASDDPVIIHAMPLRRKYHGFPGQGR